ncbi:hypothetical protein ACQP2K_26815 [Microbispora siamensis]
MISPRTFSRAVPAVTVAVLAASVTLAACTQAVSFYVRKRSSAKVANIKDGTYRVYFTTGVDYDRSSRAFTRNCGGRRRELEGLDAHPRRRVRRERHHERGGPGRLPGMTGPAD